MILGSSKISITWVYIISILFIALNTLFIVRENYILNFIPFILLFLLIGFFSLDKLIFIIVFLTPLSITLKTIVPGLDFDMYLPTEPLLLGVMILFIFKLLIENKFDKKILVHPISIAIYINLLWILITSITSSMPLVSFKFLFARLWFVIGFYFIATQLFINFKNINRFLWIYIIPFLIVIGYTIARHSEYGFLDKQAAHFVANPFFNDHTSYAAILAMFLPALFGFAFISNYSTNKKLIIRIVLAIFIFATVLSYTRAAWVSLVGALIVWIIILLRIKFRTILLITAVLATIFIVYRSEIFMKLEQDRQEASTAFGERIVSIANITTDESNLERINRWSCALRMFAEKPVFGWGPGTYQFQYAPFQLSYEKTPISTNIGDRGNAHSEYIGPLAESGVLGALTFILILIVTIYTGLKVYFNTDNKEIRMLSLVTLLGLITYFIHGVLNNFLDTDKASIPFWGFIAIIVALDVYHSRLKELSRKE